MNTDTRINISSVMGIREAIEQIFTLIHRHFDSYATDTDDTRQIEECRYYMHQLNGMLEMLELSGVAFVGISVEELLAALQERRIEPDAQTLVVVRQAIRSIYRYLDALIDGEVDNPVKLFPVYRKIMQVQGLEEISESDLFFPDIRESLPLQPVELDLDDTSRQETAKQARAQFQSGLLSWLKNADDKQSLQKMIEAVRSIEKLPAAIEQRKFWWISSGFLDSLLHQEQVVDKSVRRLCGKIEQEIRHLNKESHVVAARLTRELLYRIARSQPVSERLQEISRVYDWQIPLSTIDNQEHLDESIMDEEATASDLQSMRVLLEDINDQWRKFNAEDQENISSLLALTEQLKVLISRVSCPPLEKLAGVIHGVLSYLRIRPQSMNEGIALDIASSLLLTENAIDNFHRLSPEFPSQVDALATRIRAVTTGKGEDIDLPDLPNPDQAGHLTQEKKLFKQVAQEVLANLAQVEDILDRFFFEPEIRNDLPLLPELFNQISGVLNVLELDQASTVLDSCRALTEKLTASDHLIDQAEQMLLADALSSLGFYIEALRNSQSDAEEILATIMQRLGQKPAGLGLSTDIREIPIDFAAAADRLFESDPEQLIDPELLAVFLDESSDVLASIADHLESCYANYANQDALTTIRRDFHTLKGSGRMVKLEALSEVAWRIEQLMNRWLSEQKPATSILLDLLAESHRQFSNWCASLRKDGAVEIKAEYLLDQIRALMYGTDEQPDIATTSLAPEVFEQAPEIEPLPTITDALSDIKTGAETAIRIGDSEVPADLFRIFINEASTHVATLKQAFKQAFDLPGDDAILSVTHESMLAAHTLASTSRALELGFIAQIGQALERWFNRLLTTSNMPGQQALSYMTTAVNLLDDMLATIREHQFPSAETVQASAEITHELMRLLEEAPAIQATETEQMVEMEEMAPLESAVDEVLEEDSSASMSETEISLPVSSLQQVKDAFADLDQELLEVFLEEAQELQSEIGTNLRIWRKQPNQMNARKAVLRALHTLKGSARIADAQQVSDLAHQMESDIESLYDQTASAALLDQLETQFDTISDKVEQLRSSLQPESQPAPVTEEAEAHPELLPPAVETVSALPISTADTDQPFRKTTLRVDAELIDRLINESGESSIIRSRVEAQLYDLEQYLQDLGESVDRMRGQLREVELLAETQMPASSLPSITGQTDFDPLELDRFTRFQELTRLMAESMDDVVTIHKSLREIQRAATMTVDQQAHLNRQLQQDLLRIRTIPFSHYSERLYRAVRQVTKDTGKQANLIIQGDSIEFDRGVLDKISSSLEHLLRNALVHGIETPEERLSIGKAEAGQITLDLHRDGNEIVMVLQDDGIGLDAERIREKARQLGLGSPENEQDDEQWYPLIFTHGFSTLDGVTDIAGRGVGLDIVRNELGELGGNIAVTSEKNRGTTFTLRFPVTLALTQALMVKAGDSTYAIPIAIVAHVLEMNAETLGTAYQEHHLIWNGNRFPLGYLPHLLGVSHTFPEIRRSNRIVLLQTEHEQLAIHADALIGQCEVVIKNIGPQLSNAPGIEGATITGDGSIVLIINPIKLLQREQVRELLSAGPMTPVDAADIHPSATAPVVMIVDDSLTVRKVTSRLLERQGYEILIAKDGVGALQLLRETIPAIMLVDIEMPHMDGFELIRAVRNNPELQNIPIIIISSRTAEKHRKVAEELGVNEFMGKPYQEDELLQHIERLIKEGC
ncbi:chemosensory pili system protein ChpA (sensor histidine kinase/response regulator) [Nitrosomonas eutropha]|uniref:hybrid sensor histidine kinase/response regulator n=1 Tax=Nitrosomonas eutropha TaxID=916 RepID=UPI000898E8AF|nr:Hpt domain-containing protein [Nitrosomonas eutropha]SDV99595.1 chemosensory pili system protein ChpA (sensor histidine kinase/response regulator) [Nitrosomonas eutropha]